MGAQTMNSPAQRRVALSIGALGVVYGDIGTSPLYALRECFTGPHGVDPTPANVLGVVSLVFWSLTIIVSIKYLTLVMRATNRGEGGILALLSLTGASGRAQKKFRRALLALGIVGAALLYGDGIITPAVTVLGAIEGLEIATPLFKPFVVPIALVVLVALFTVQRHGTGRVGSIFGPVMVVWFLVLALLGLRGIWMSPEIVAALDPRHGVSFLFENGRTTFVVLGSVFLVVTGAEALYADMGHFSAGPIRQAWFSLVFPGLVLNYFGEGGLLLANPEAATNPFYLLAPGWATLPLVGLATMAAVIASQALISGAYSLTMQAVQMGYLPRLQILHTSHAERGQIYMPRVNTALMLACLGLVLAFGSSSALAGAYGIAVSLTMLITTMLFFAAVQRQWHWHPLVAALTCVIFALLELAFVGANAMKFLQGGWFPLAVAALMFTQMMTWHKGRAALRAKLSESYLPFQLFLDDLANQNVPRVPGTAVFLSGNPNGTPIALLHNLRHNKVLHERVVVLTISTAEVPVIASEERVKIERLRPDIHRVLACYGFIERPNVPELLEQCAAQGLEYDSEQTTFFVSRETIVPGPRRTFSNWRRRLFAAMARNAQPVSAYFQLPPNRVVELGMQVEL
jgi:KUP system potassium uptake protein